MWLAAIGLVAVQGHNLILTEGGMYFVGTAGVLVHDNTPILDAMPAAASAAAN